MSLHASFRALSCPIPSKSHLYFFFLLPSATQRNVIPPFPIPDADLEESLAARYGVNMIRIGLGS